MLPGNGRVAAGYIYKSRLEPLDASAALGVNQSTPLCSKRSSHTFARVLELTCHQHTNFWMNIDTYWSRFRYQCGKKTGIQNLSEFQTDNRRTCTSRSLLCRHWSLSLAFDFTMRWVRGREQKFLTATLGGTTRLLLASCPPLGQSYPRHTRPPAALGKSWVHASVAPPYNPRHTRTRTFICLRRERWGRLLLI